jgi:hypothetical protein
MASVQVGWTAKVELEIPVAFKCVHCGVESVAIVKAKGQDEAFDLFAAFRDRAKERAQRLAEASALRNAHRLAPLGKCAACEKFDVGARERHSDSLNNATALTAGVGLVMGVSGGMIWPRSPSFVLAILGAIIGGVSRHFQHQWETEVEQRVRVLPAAEAEFKRAVPLPDEPKTGDGSIDVPSANDFVLPLGVLALGVALAVRFVGAPTSFALFGRMVQLDNDNTAQVVQFAISLGALGVIMWGMVLQWNKRARVKQVLRDRLLLVLGLLGFLGYFNFGHLHFGNFVHVWDTYHYVMGAKYFPEMGYDKMYDCAAIANAENGRRDEVVRQTLTDLRTNIIVKTDELLAHPERCKENFSEQRWKEYRADIAAFRGMVGEPRWREIHLDHGYNATPVWTLAGYWLTNGHGPVTMEQLRNLNLIDPIYLTLTVLIIWWAFGARAFAIAAIVLGCHFPNRYYWTGGAFLRHDWIFFFVASICLLKKNRPGLAGAAFAYTTLLRLFPGLAAAGVAVAAFEYFRVNKKLDPRFLRYVVGGAVATALLVGASFFFFGGPTTWQRFAQNTVKHANTPLTNHMGLRTVLSWRPDSIGQKTVRPGLIDSWYLWKSTRLDNWQQAKPLMWLTFALGLVLVWLALKHSGSDPWLGAAMGVGFIVIGAELTNYYYCFLLGIAVLHEKRREVGAILAALCAVSHYLNWGPIQWMSHWLDEQYVTMSLAALFAVGGIWWVFTKMAARSVAPEEPAFSLVHSVVPSASSNAWVASVAKKKKR